MNAFGLPGSPGYDVQVFTGEGTATTSGWQIWRKPQGRSACNIFLVGSGGNGGNGVVGANSTAGGGGGGASGSQVILNIPLSFLPNLLYLNLLGGSSNGTDAAPSSIAIQPDATLAHNIAFANNGGFGGNASAGTGGAAGVAGSIPTVAQMRLGWAFLSLALVGQNGIIGGAAVSGGPLTLPATGLRVTGGTGGGGLPAAAAAGTSGGSFAAITAPSLYPVHIGGAGSATATNPAENGSNGYEVTQIGRMFYGGTGGASTHGTATGGGLVGSRGGIGGYGCGGGGGGGALTTSSQGLGGIGGPALAIITCW
jgi:hypothetical protein